jgi:hypothetical protein
MELSRERGRRRDQLRFLSSADFRNAVIQISAMRQIVERKAKSAVGVRNISKHKEIAL